MKDKLVVFIIGLLVGAIISTSSIYFYTVANNKNNNYDNQEIQLNGGNGPGGQMGEPPERPDGQGNNQMPSAPENN